MAALALQTKIDLGDSVLYERIRNLNKGVREMAVFWGHVLTYIVRFILLAAAAVAGVFVGKMIREKKDQKG